MTFSTMDAHTTDPRIGHPAAEQDSNCHHEYSHPRSLGSYKEKDLPLLVGVPLAAAIVAANGQDNSDERYRNSPYRAATNYHEQQSQPKSDRTPLTDGVGLNGHYADQENKLRCPNQPSASTPLGPALTESPAVVRRRRLKSSVSLDGSPVIRRRAELTLHSPDVGTPASGSPRVIQSATLCRERPSESEKHTNNTRTVLMRTRSLTSVGTNGHLLDFTYPTLPGKIRSSECGKSSPDHSEGSSQVLIAMAGLQVVTEENTDEVGVRIARQGTTNDQYPRNHDRPQPSFDHQRPTHLRDMSPLSGMDGPAGGDAKEVPDYQKAPIPTKSRIAQWLQGLEPTTGPSLIHDHPEERTHVETNMFPDIVER